MGLVVPAGFLSSFGFDPLSLSPSLWLDAADASTLFDATTGGSLVSAGGSVGRWADKSGNSRHATQATLLSRPTRQTSVKNAQDVVRFDGSDDFLTTPAFAGLQNFERFIVCNDRSSPSQVRIIVAQGSAYDTPNPGADYMLNTGRGIEASHNGGSLTANLSQRRTTGMTFPGTTFILAGQRSDGTHAGHVLRVNRVAVAVLSPYSGNPGTFTKTATAYGIGGRNNGSLPYNGDICEFFHFDRVLTTTERDDLEAYLMTKWGLS